jgi:hypothetical protein
MLERPQNFIFEAIRAIQKDIMGAKHINILVGENQISNSRINGSGQSI